MRKQLLLIMFLVSQTAFGQKHEIGLTLGGVLPQDRGTAPNAVRLGGGTALQGNYGYRFFEGRAAAIYGELHFLANPLRDIGSGNPAASRDVATLFVTPGIRVKFASARSLSPYVAVGGGYALFEQSLLTLGGAPNPASRNVHRGVFDFGGGVDTKLWRWIGLRAEIRDFYSGSPAYNLAGLGGGQHNVVVGGGFVLKWGE
jgi:hypothetical protein